VKGYTFHWPVLWQHADLLWDGLKLTVQLFVICSVLSLALGLVVGVVASSRSAWLRGLAEAYVELIRNVPIVVKLFFIYFALGFEAFPAAIIGLSLHQSSYMGEVIRAGIKSVPRGQVEASQATGLSLLAVYRYVVLPQALIIAIPPMTTQFLEVLKNSSLAMTITVAELTAQTLLIESLTFRGFEVATAVTALYLLLSLVVAVLFNGVERWIAARHTSVSTLLTQGRRLAEEAQHVAAS
jgi:polar amino acid transport system permease protein